jgi:tRNA pseudouridine38-40 synthase
MTHTLRRFALLVEYDGTPFSGSQFQANGPSVQAELERTIEEMTGSFARVAFAGRTDAGVHALGQVACFDTPASYSCEQLVGGINVRLPKSVSVRAARQVDPLFDPRREAIARRYRYTIVRSTVRAPLEHKRAWQVATPLDLNFMRRAARLLVGEHDFAAFASIEAASQGSTQREVRSIDLRCSGRQLLLDVVANAFLMHQMRRTAAALVDVGSARMTIEDFERHLTQAQPGSYFRAAPAYGLCLLSVSYDPPLFPNERELD